MVRYDDPVEVRTGAGGLDGPAQFLWRGRLWKVRTVLERRRSQDLPSREVWRVAAGRGRLDQGGPSGSEVFELVHEVSAGRWLLSAGSGARVGAGVHE